MVTEFDDFLNYIEEYSSTIPTTLQSEGAPPVSDNSNLTNEVTSEEETTLPVLHAESVSTEIPEEEPQEIQPVDISMDDVDALISGLSGAGNETPVDTPVENNNVQEVSVNYLGEEYVEGEDEEEEEEETTQEEAPPLIAPNSPTLTIDDAHSRFSGTEWFEDMKNKEVLIAGLGGIGSWLALNIARLGVHKIILYDDDIVEAGNMSGQLYSTYDVGQHKVTVLGDLIRDFTSNVLVNSFNSRFTEGMAPWKIMMCGFDSIPSRRTFFNVWKSQLDNGDKTKCLFMDGRLSIDTLQIIAIQGDDTENMKKYEQVFLFDESQADSVICSMKQTSYMAAMIGSMMANIFVNWVAQSKDPIIPYRVPFFTQYEAQHMLFKTEY